MEYDLLRHMLSKQKQLQEKAYGHDLDAMTNVERIEFLKINILALEDELHEALAEVGWKPWADSRHINIDQLRGELIDAWHFMMNLFITAGMDAQMITDMYLAKREKNIKRQEEGYDGVSGKCKVCKRALDDVIWGDVTDDHGNRYCSQVCWQKDPDAHPNATVNSGPVEGMINNGG